MTRVAEKFYRKYIRIPPNESVDVRRIINIVNHPIYQRLIRISQLGPTLNIFPGAVHNRFEHSLGVHNKTKKLCQRLVEDGVMKQSEAYNVSIFALLHDIGHGPFSHIIEELTPINHDRVGLKLINLMAEEIEKSGGSLDYIENLFKHKNPFYKIVMDKNMGTDKLDYLFRDIYHTGFGQIPDVETMLNYLTFIDGNLVIDKKSLESARQVQALYTYMFKQVYLHKSSMISQRYLQKMISLWLERSQFKPKDLWRLNDAELLAHLYLSDDKKIAEMYRSYVSRNLPMSGLVIRLKDRQFKERIAGKKIRLIGESQEFFDQFIKKSSPADLEKIESSIADYLKIDSSRIVVVPILTPWRFIPEDILYHDNGQIYSLRKTHKDYFDSLKCDLDDYIAVRVCIVGERELLYKKADQVYRLIKQSI
jgi:HD superfamily phosphohydrolase